MLSTRLLALLPPTSDSADRLQPPASNGESRLLQLLKAAEPSVLKAGGRENVEGGRGRNGSGLWGTDGGLGLPGDVAIGAIPWGPTLSLRLTSGEGGANTLGVLGMEGDTDIDRRWRDRRLACVGAGRWLRWLELRCC